MSISSSNTVAAFREHIRAELDAFAWDEWAQVGVFAPTDRHDRWAVDPEALLLFGFEVGRNDARLFDEVLDWLLTNEKLVSVQRLRNLCVDEQDRQLAEAALSWIAHQRPRTGFVTHSTENQPDQPVLLFRTSAQQVKHPDPVFLEFGLIKPDSDPSGKSRAPDLGLPVNFAFRMRQLFGVNSRAEVIRYLITSSEGAVGAQVLAESAGFAKRNVNETLAALAATGVVTTFEIGNERRYSLNRRQWGELLGLKPASWPTHRDWPRLLSAFRRLSRWIEDTSHDQLSDYMLASEARSLMDTLQPDFAFAGIPPVGLTAPQGEAYWDYFAQTIEHVLAMIKALSL